MKKIGNSSIFYEKYKPQCIEDVILPEALKQSLIYQIQNKDIKNIGLFSDTPGTGKSSLAEVLLKELKCDAKWINASMDSGIDILRTEILRFASTSSSNDELKVVVMDESDYLNTNSTQPAFRGFLDEFSKNCRFIFTGNYKEKLIEPLLNRLQVIDFNEFKKEEMVRPIFERLKFILENEKIEYKQEDLIPIINTYYPSIRGMIGAIQECSITGKLILQKLDDINVYDKVMKLVSPSYYLEMIKEVNELSSPDNMYTYMYKNASKYFLPANYPKVIVTIAKYQSMNYAVRDKHLNLCACLTELVSLTNNK